MVDRREHSRFDVELPVRFVSEDEFLVEYTQNISVGGLFIRTDNPAPEGTELQLSLELPTTDAVVPMVGKVISSITPEIAVETKVEAGMGIRLSPPEPVAAQVLAAYVEAMEKGNRGRVLLVDDDPTVLFALATILRTEHLSVVALSDPVLALKALTYTGFDAVLTDLSMPDMDGLEFLDELAKIRSAGSIPTVLFTALGGVELETIAKQRGIRHFLRKPFGVAELKAVMDEILSGDPNPGSAAGQETQVPGQGAKLETKRLARLLVPLQELIERKLTPDEAFILSRLASGPLAVADLVRLSKLPEDRVLDFLRRCIVDGTITTG